MQFPGIQSHRHLSSFGSLLLLIACCAIFIFRGPVRALTDQGINDLLSPYIQSVAWWHGADPYSPRSLLRFWPNQALAARPDVRQIQDGTILIHHGIPTAYPLTSFLLLGPLTLLSWPVFKVLWITGNIVLFFAVVRSLVSWSGLHKRGKHIFLLAALLLAPFHTGIATCNVAITAVELGVLAVSSSHIRNQWTTGLLIALSTGLKPQIGLVFLAYYFAQCRWKIFGVAVAGTVVMSSVALARMAHVSWLANYSVDSRALLSTGILGDFTERNPTRFGLVNLQVALYPWLHDRHVTNICALVISALLATTALVLISRLRIRDDLLCLSAICTVSLLPVYHRFYDAALLIIPLCWLIRRLSDSAGIDDKLSPDLLGRMIPWLGLLAIVAFSIPGGSILEVLSARGVIPPRLLGTVWWNGVVMAHSVWALVILLAVLLYEMARYQTLAAHLTIASSYNY